MCPELTQSININYSGSIKFNADDTFSRDISTTVEVTTRYPKSCIEDATCEEIDPSCTDLGDTCSCTNENIESDMASGNFVINNDNTLTTIENPGTEEEDRDTFSYCVQGNTMHILIEPKGLEPVSVVLTR